MGKWGCVSNFSGTKNRKIDDDDDDDDDNNNNNNLPYTPHARAICIYVGLNSSVNFLKFSE